MTIIRKAPGGLLFLLACASLCAAVLSGLDPAAPVSARCLVLLAVAAVCFALSRTRAGTAMLFLLGSFICAGAHFLGFPIPPWSLPLFCFSVLGLFIWRGVRRSLGSADAGTVSPGAAALQIGLFSLLALGLATTLWFGAVRPFSPPTRELKLITELKRMELLAVLGVSRTEIVLSVDPELESELPPEDWQEGGGGGEKESAAVDDAGTEASEQELPPEDGQSKEREGAEAVGYALPGSRAWLALPVLPLLAALFIVLRILSRRRWERAVKALSPEEAVVNYYRFFLKRLSGAGLRRSGSQTLREFAALHAPRLAPLLPEDCDFSALTELYERAYYGLGRVTAEERAAVEMAYAFFPAALRRNRASLRK